MSLQDEMSIALDDVATNDWYKTSMMDEDRLDPRDLDNISVFSKSDRGYSPGAVLTPPVCLNHYMFCFMFLYSILKVLSFRNVTLVLNFDVRSSIMCVFFLEVCHIIAAYM